MLKYELESLEGIDESTQALYSAGEDGKFRLNIDGLPLPEDTSALKNALAHERAERKRAADERKKAEDAARKAAEEKARQEGDVAALEKSWQEKLDAGVNEWKGKYESERGHVTNLLVDNVASTMANELAVTGSAVALVPHIRSRLTVEYADGKPVTRVLDGKGQPSAATLDELKAEFASNSAFAPIIAQTKASGGGAVGAGAGAGGAALKRSEMSSVQKREFIAKHGQEKFLQLPK